MYTQRGVCGGMRVCVHRDEGVSTHTSTHAHPHRDEGVCGGICVWTNVCVCGGMRVCVEESIIKILKSSALQSHSTEKEG